MAFSAKEKCSDPLNTLEGNMPSEERVFSISDNNKGLWCPLKSLFCQEGYCHGCQVYLDWQKRGNIAVVCAWCGKLMDIKPGLGESGISHGICEQCEERYFKKEGGGNQRVAGKR